MKAKQLKLEEIVTDGGTQMRVRLQEAVCLEYMEAYLAGEELPPVDVFFDGSTYWLADGFHRYHGAKHAESPTINATVHQGTQRDAILFAVGANGKHGLKRTNEDKRQAVLTLLNDATWSTRSTRWIAEHCRVSESLVAEVRKEIQVTEKAPGPVTGKDGKSYPPKEKAEKPAAKEPEPAPDEPKQPSGGTTFNPSEWEQESVKDGLGEEVTGELRKPFELRQGVQEQRNKLVSIKSWLTANINHPGAFALASAQQRIVIDIDNVDTELKFYAPFATCCYCQNKMPTVANCEACHGKGWVTKSIYDAAPKGMKRGKN